MEQGKPGRVVLGRDGSDQPKPTAPHMNRPGMPLVGNNPDKNNPDKPVGLLGGRSQKLGA